MIKNHLLEVNINVIQCKDNVKKPSYPYLVPHPIKDLLGMVPAVNMLMRSLYPGRISALHNSKPSVAIYQLSQQSGRRS